MPFLTRGARKAVESMKNEVTDWLPRDFPETKELGWFRDNFLGDQFVVISWEGCSEDDPRFHLLVDKLKAESLEHEVTGEILKAHELGDRLHLHTVGDYYEEWGDDGQKWLQGKDETWYYVTKNGELHQWAGESNVLGAAVRYAEQLFRGHNKVKSKRLIARFGEETNNEFYRDPRKFAARWFKSIETGPEILDRLAGPDGSLLRGENYSTEGAFRAKVLANQRLTGLLFGPTPPNGFGWTWYEFKQEFTEEGLASLPDGTQEAFEDFVSEIVEDKYDGDIENLVKAPSDLQLEHWYSFFDQNEIAPPMRQTAILATLNTPALYQLKRVVGRPILGKPRGRVLELASGECGIPPADLRLGGPPVDNVAIDEEGSRTLLKLVSFSAIVGLSLAYLSFRSIKVTLMVTLVGALAAISSLGFVWYGGSSVDAILLSMPPLVYVLGLSGAVHIVNYYREACEENGPEGAAETAVRHGWFPCTLAAFTTSLGLISLYASTLIPIKKFGLYSAIGTMATVILLFTFLPSCLVIWKAGYKKKTGDSNEGKGFHEMVAHVWDRIGCWVIRNHWVVNTTCIILMIVASVGLFKIRTSVQLLKLFSQTAKIITDYHWLEDNMGMLIPMELVMKVEPDALINEDHAVDDGVDRDLMLTRFERLKAEQRIREVLNREFGEPGTGVVGRGMALDVFVPSPPSSRDIGTFAGQRRIQEFNRGLEVSKDDVRDYLHVDEKDGRELWRISLRLGAFNDVDYGEFVLDLKRAVEPVLTAYQTRNRIIRTLRGPPAGQESPDSDDLADVSDESGSTEPATRRIVVLGAISPETEELRREAALQLLAENDAEAKSSQGLVDQTAIFCRQLSEIFEEKMFVHRLSTKAKNSIVFLDPDQEQTAKAFEDQEAFDKILDWADCVVAVRDHELFEFSEIEKKSKRFIDARDHAFKIDEVNKTAISPTALDVKKNELPGHEDVVVSVAYTGLVPIVYKAQRTLLTSLVVSIGLAFVMIAFVMMVLLRDWRGKLGITNIVNLPGGMVSMLPNVFPVVLIFGYMGHRNTLVDIGTMMTASVAMGVAVDDTIHFLSWYRIGLRKGLRRHEAIRAAYSKVATAMTQTTLIGGFGLSVFYFSSFTPTERFGVMMLVLLCAALIGDLIFLPALLASPLGRFFGREQVRNDSDESIGEQVETSQSHASSTGANTPAGANGSEKEGGKRRPLSSDVPNRVRADHSHDIAE